MYRRAVEIFACPSSRREYSILYFLQIFVVVI